MRMQCIERLYKPVFDKEKKMKTLNCKRLKNKYFFLSVVLLLVLSFISWLVVSELVYNVIIRNYTQPGWAEPDKRFSLKCVIRGAISWEGYISCGARFVSDIFPIFAVIPTIPFLFERKSYFSIGASRFPNRKKELWKSVFFYSLQGGLALSTAYFIYFTLGNLYLFRALNDIGGFADIFPAGFYHDHPYLFFVFMTVAMYYPFGFLFAMFACGLSLFCDKEILVIIIPVVTYILTSYIGFHMDIRCLQISSCQTVFNTTTSTLDCYIPLIPLLLFDVVFVSLGVKKRSEFIS